MTEVNQFNASFHHTKLGIKGVVLERSQLASPLVSMSVRQNGFDDGNNIDTETDEGHTGVGNIDMGSYRKSAESSPTWNDKIRYSQGIEDYIYLLLGKDTITPYSNDTGTINGIYNHHYEMSPTNPSELPLATIYHGYDMTETDGRVFNNSMLNEFEFTMSSDDMPSCSVTFLSDYNYVNCVNPTKNFLADHLQRTAMANHTHVFIGDVGATAKQMLANPIDCFTEASFNVSNNASSQMCHNNNFGENEKTMGQRELTGSITMPWKARTKYFETEYECYNKYGHLVSELITQKQIWYLCEGGNIPITNDDTTVSSGIPYKLLFKFPVIEASKVNSTKSGNENKEITYEWKNVEQPSQSYMICDIVSDLSALHIDSTGIARDTIFATEEDMLANA